MKITDDVGHKLLAYIHAAESQGYALTTAELDRYADRPSRTRNVFAELTRGMVAGITTESGGGYLTRLGWAVEKDGKVHLTALGSAMLRHLEATERAAAAQPSVAVVLEQGNEFAFASVVAKIAEIGECTFVDPYFGAGEVEVVFRTTSVTRVITGGKPANRVRTLAAAVAALRAGGVETPEIRVSDDFHDRYIVPASGPVWLLGTSLNGVGNRLSTMVELPEAPAGAAVRQAVAKAWDEGAALAASVEPPTAAAGPPA